MSGLFTINSMEEILYSTATELFRLLNKRLYAPIKLSFHLLLPKQVLCMTCNWDNKIPQWVLLPQCAVKVFTHTGYREKKSLRCKKLYIL